MTRLPLALAVLILTACQQAPSDPPGLSYPLAVYSPEFSRALAQQLRKAPAETQTAIMDYIKMRCEIKPELPICPDLRK